MSSDFENQLLAAARGRDISSNPFVRSVSDGTFPRAALRSYAADLAALTSSFPQVLSSILACCDDPAVRQALLANLLEEEGAVSFSLGKGLVVDSDSRHCELAWRFARAAGVSRDDARHASAGSAWLSAELYAGRWVGPLAYVTVGYESNIPPTFRLLTEGLRRHYAFTEEELTFFNMHIVDDERHGADGAQMIVAVATMPAMKQQALEGTRRGAAAFWHFHRKHATRIPTP